MIRYIFVSHGHIFTKSRKKMDAIFVACESGDLAAVRDLVVADPKIVYARNYWESVPLHSAARNGRLEVAKFLVGKGADIHATNKQRTTPLHSASWYGHLSVAEFLVAEGANVNAKDIDGWTPLHSAARYGKLDVVMYLWPLCASDQEDIKYEYVNKLDHAARMCLKLAECGFTSDMITFP
jgi:ankyrin repeat protein